jgi:prophage antirepressor-like protein
MLSIQVFPQTDTEIVTILEEGTGIAWFHAGHISKILEFSNPYRYLPTVLDNFEYKEIKAEAGRPSLFVREEGVYQLIMASKSQCAVIFKKWLAYEVLPKIRKQGHFGNSPNSDSSGSAFWSLIDNATQRGIEPERAIDLHRRMNGETPPMPSNLSNQSNQSKSPKSPAVSRPQVTTVVDVADFMAKVQSLVDEGLLDGRHVVEVVRRRSSGRKWMAIHGPTVWIAVMARYSLPYDRLSLERSIVQGGGFVDQQTQKFYRSLSDKVKSAPRKCWLVPI